MEDKQVLSISKRLIETRKERDLTLDDAAKLEAEGFFDEPVFSCVAAVPENFTRVQRDNLRVRAKASGFDNIEIIPEHEAIILALGGKGRTLVYDLGASACRMFMLDGSELAESVIIEDVCGREFDQRLRDYLIERFSVESIDAGDVVRIRNALSAESMTTWRETRILREELERLIHFAVKRTARVLARMERVHRPEKIILTGGCVKIPCVWTTLAGTLSITPEYRGNLVAEGAAFRAKALQKGTRQSKKADNSARIRELRADIIGLEEKLTRRQKDRVYAMFRQAEGINDSGVIALMESMIRDIRNA